MCLESLCHRVNNTGMDGAASEHSTFNVSVVRMQLIFEIIDIKFFHFCLSIIIITNCDGYRRNMVVPSNILD